MGSRSALERRLADVTGFEQPRSELEQYPTPADVAAYLVHLADITGDIEGRTVLDLGTGTGMLALGAATRGPAQVVGLDRDRAPLLTARENEQRIAPETSVHWVLGDATRAPLCPSGPTTVLMNPPFGAQRGQTHADRRFLETAAQVADVSYSIHNEGSKEFVESFANDNGGEVTRAIRAELPLDHQFSFHEHERETLQAELFRIVWRHR